MGKKSKNPQPNAPDLQQTLLESNIARQPARNPYYPDTEVESALLPPPPYSNLSVSADQANYFAPPMAQSVPLSGANYARFSNRSGHNVPATVIVQQPQQIYIDRKFEKHQRKVRSFNNEILLMALFVIGLSLYAHTIFTQRPCLDFLIHSPAKDVSITIFTVQKMHLWVAYGSIVLLVICLAKCSSLDNRSHSCYLLFISLMTFVGTLFTGYLAYLAFYSPCSLKPSELAANTIKTLVGSFVDTLPSPEKRVFGESNVFDLARDDPRGVWIFFIDLLNFVFYLSGFVSAVVLC